MKFREGLSLISDFATIIGVSIGGIIGTPLISTLLGREFSIFNFITATLFYLGYVIVILSFLIVFGRLTWQEFRNKVYFTAGIGVFFILLFSALVAGSFMPCRDFYASMLGNDYFFPDPATKVVEKLQSSYIAAQSKVVGNVAFHKGTDIGNYRVICYLKYHDNSYFELHGFMGPTGNGTAMAGISADGTFAVPKIDAISNTTANYLEGVMIAVVTRLDGKVVDRYPTGVTDKNALDLKKIGAVTEVLPVTDLPAALANSGGGPQLKR